MGYKKDIILLVNSERDSFSVRVILNPGAKGGEVLIFNSERRVRFKTRFFLIIYISINTPLQPQHTF